MRERRRAQGGGPRIVHGWPSGHPDALRLVDYAAGRLPRRQAEAVREHCRRCERCGDQLAAVIMIRRERVRAAPRRRRGLAAAAVLLALAGAGVWWTVGRGAIVAVGARGEAAAGSSVTPVGDAVPALAVGLTGDPRRGVRLRLIATMGRMWVRLHRPADPRAAAQAEFDATRSEESVWPDAPLMAALDALAAGRVREARRILGPFEGSDDPFASWLLAVVLQEAEPGSARARRAVEHALAQRSLTAAADPQSLGFMDRALLFYRALELLRAGRPWRASSVLSRLSSNGDLRDEWAREASWLLLGLYNGRR